MSKKKKIIIGAICAIVLLVGAVAAALLMKGKNAQFGSIEWKKRQYGAICERGVTEGLETDTTEYAICTRDLGYKIKAIEPQQSQQENSQNGTNTTATPSVSDAQTQDGKRAACASLRATNLDDLIATNKRQGISEADTRTTYNSGIAQCDNLGY
jgi:hypothetical protein